MKVIVLPGLGGTGQLLEPFCKAMPDEHQSQALSYDASLVSYGDVARWVRSQLPKGDYVIVAESFSGPVAITLAAEDIPGLCGIVCVATFARTPRYIPQIALSFARCLPLTSRIFVRIGMPFLMGRWGTSAFREKFASILGPVPKATLLGRVNAVARVDVAARLSQLQIPVLYLQASRDRLVPRSAAQGFEKVKVVDGPHFLLQANPIAAAAEIVTFIGTLSAPNGP